MNLIRVNAQNVNMFPIIANYLPATDLAHFATSCKILHADIQKIALEAHQKEQKEQATLALYQALSIEGKPVTTKVADIRAWFTEQSASTFSAITQLDLSNHRLSVVPQELRYLTNLQRLNLSGNQLRALPENLFHGLNNLNWLNLGGNQLRELPENLFNGLNNLCFIDFCKNPINQLLFPLDRDNLKTKVQIAEALAKPHFEMTYDTGWGYSLGTVGESSHLKGWREPIPMVWTEGNIWKGCYAGEDHRPFKYVLIHPDGSYQYEQGENRTSKSDPRPIIGWDPK